MTDSTFIAEVQRIITSTGDGWPAQALDIILRRYACATGTIHALNRNADVLHLVAQRGIPDAILHQVRAIPVGKGMAGLAAQRRDAVQVCNLQTDDSGDARPAAKMTEMRGAITVPIIVNDDLLGTLGVARPDSWEFTATQIDALKRLGELIGQRLALPLACPDARDDSNASL